VTDALSDLLDKFDGQLHHLSRRQFLVEAFQAELDKVTRGEGFRIRNGVLWMMFLDTRDTLVTHLASWARGVYQPGGLIDQLRANHARDLPTERPAESRDDDSSWRVRRDREHAEALARLFPDTSEPHPSDSQFDQLRDTFVARMKPVVDDAQNRVRPYDPDPQAGSVKMLDVPALRAAVSYAERLMNDLSMVGRHSEHDHQEMNTPDAADVVPDMVDAILLGPPEQIERVREGLDRTAFYDELHHRQAKEAAQYFNNKLFSSSTAAAVSAAPTPPRYVGFFPALPLARNLELGEWVVGTPEDNTPWASRRFRDLSESLVRSFEKVRFKGGAMLWHRDRGFDGSKPSDEEIQAIRAAVAFAVLDANDPLPYLNKGHYMATTDNADLFIQPIDEDGGITHSRKGELKRILVGGMKIGDEPPPLGDAVEHISSPVRASAELAAAIYAAAQSGTGDGPAITTAADWHRGALVNSSVMTLQHRVIALKTGFEALLPAPNSRQCARRLRALFEQTTAGHRQDLPWIGLLWSPKEITNLQRTYVTREGDTRPDVRSELEDWFVAFTDARNDVIHRGTTSVGSWIYKAPSERPLSRYAGTLFMTAERLLREAIKAKLGVNVLLCGPVRRRKRIAEFVEAAESAPPAPQPPPAPPDQAELDRRAREVAIRERIEKEPSSPDRDLAALLAALGVSAANVVRLRKAHGCASASEDVAQESSMRMMDKWHADVGNVDKRDEGHCSGILVSGTECQTLRAAGAEDELPDLWWRCP
jgi:hypothetical protein